PCADSAAHDFPTCGYWSSSPSVLALSGCYPPPEQRGMSQNCETGGRQRHGSPGWFVPLFSATLVAVSPGFAALTSPVPVAQSATSTTGSAGRATPLPHCVVR